MELLPCKEAKLSWLTFAFVFLVFHRTRFSIHCLSESTQSDAVRAAVDRSLLLHALPPRNRKPGMHVENDAQLFHSDLLSRLLRMMSRILESRLMSNDYLIKYLINKLKKQLLNTRHVAPLFIKIEITIINSGHTHRRSVRNMLQIVCISCGNVMH